MRVLVFGSKDYKNYNELIRQLTVLLDDRKHFYPEDKDYIFVHTAFLGAENMVTEYVGKTHKFLRQKGYKIKEELIKYQAAQSDMQMLESNPDFVLIFGDSPRNRQAKRLVEAMEIPYRLIKD